jgi:hypothetical protein
MAQGSGGSVFSIAAFACCAAAFFGYGPMLAILGMILAAVAWSLGEGLAGAAALVAVVVLLLSFVMPPAVVLGNL